MYVWDETAIPAWSIRALIFTKQILMDLLAVIASEFRGITYSVRDLVSMSKEVGV